MKPTMKTRLLALAVAGVSALTLSACGDHPEASSLAADSPQELAQIHVEAITSGDMSTVCAYARKNATVKVETYFGGRKECAENAFAAAEWNEQMESKSRSPWRYVTYPYEGEIDYQNLDVRYRDSTAFVSLPGNGERGIVMEVTYVEELDGWQVTSPF